MEASEDERDSDASMSDADSVSEVEDIGRDATSWARKLLFKDTPSSSQFPSIFDAYFTQASKTSKTSSNVFSQLVPPLSPEEFHERIRELKNPALDEGITALSDSHVAYFPAYIAELASNFNLLFYGFGSKRKLLNRFARLCAKKGHVVITNTFFPSFTLKDFLASAEQVIGAPDVPNVGTGLEAQCRRILEKYVQKPTARHLFLIIHNIDAPALRTERSKSCLAALASHPSIHIAASVDHIMSPLLWSMTESFAHSRPSQPNSDSGGINPPGRQTLPTGGFSWLWHDLTTMQPYDFELAYADRTSFSGASASQRARTGQANIASIGSAGGMIAEGAAKHVLASVTAKAKRLFALLCVKQRSAIDAVAAETGSNAHIQPGPHVATSYELLFAAARDEFIATNDTAMHALLGEFRDHGLVVSSTAADGGEALWIPLSTNTLERLASENS